MNSKQSILIIPAEKKDLEYVFNIINELENTSFDFKTFSENYNQNLKNDLIDYFIVKSNGINCGFISCYTQIYLHHNSKVVEIQEFIIGSKYQNHGIGKEVLNQIKIKYKNKGILQLEVCTNKKREKSQQFYKNNGFIESHYKYTMEL